MVGRHSLRSPQFRRTPQIDALTYFAHRGAIGGHVAHEAQPAGDFAFAVQPSVPVRGGFVGFVAALGGFEIAHVVQHHQDDG